MGAPALHGLVPWPPLLAKTKKIIQQIILSKQQQQLVEGESKKKKRRVVEKFHRNTLLKETSTRSMIGRLIMKMVLREFSNGVPQQHKQNPKYMKRYVRLMKETIDCLPLRALVLFSQGKFTYSLLDAVIHVMNGDYFNGLNGLIQQAA